MTPDRLRECLRALGLSQRALALLVGYDERTVRRWAAGRASVPHDVSVWIDRSARARDEIGPPPVR